MTHLIEGELSLNSVIHFSRRGPHTSSIANQSSSSPAISIAEFVMVPCGFLIIIILEQTKYRGCAPREFTKNNPTVAMAG